jgi:hypothetical protein
MNHYLEENVHSSHMHFMHPFRDSGSVGKQVPCRSTTPGEILVARRGGLSSSTNGASIQHLETIYTTFRHFLEIASCTFPITQKPKFRRKRTVLSLKNVS